MNRAALSMGERIAGGSALALLIIMFLPWYGAKVNISGSGSGSGIGSGNVSGNANAWDAFSSIDVVLLLVILVVVALVAARVANAVPSGVPAPVIIVGAGMLAVVLVAYRLIDLPGESGGTPGVTVEITRQIGVFLGLLAAAAIAFGGYRAMS